jgi:hypothetical protein
LGFTLLASAAVQSAGFVPPQNLNPGQSSQPSLDPSYEQEAWLVYTYDIDTSGDVINMKIHSSNGITAVEDKFYNHVNSMKFRPGTRDGNPVKVSAGPFVYTWILDKTRTMTPEFSEIYQQAWDMFKQENYDGASELAASLQNMPGRNAYEETKFQILAASLNSRWGEELAELANLKRIVEFQSLADRNRFGNPYVEGDQYLLILERIQTVQLGMMMLADGEATLNKMIMRDGDSEVTQRAKLAYQDAEGKFRAMPDVSIAGELTPLYRDGQGVWETRLSRDKFSLSNVKGAIDTVYLACQVGGDKRLRYPARDPWVTPAGWNNCKLEVAGKPGTRFRAHQIAR